ncbi:hypothetical protein MYAM1_001830 [Malassezia yamatoensis]|uniref:SLC41A/MgtE integral membrane domain-containing protein n=1 Tax=Malassezia yamatoensis TaxID=253288 RepID=A0AAJ5YSR9_9BASI|nr:hypothetical protein MYAM1_001830 [Malassezia yamatoensis]
MSFCIQTLPMLIMAAAGLLLSGRELDRISRWNVFRAVDKFLILVPVMLNLKGNLELNLTLRMSTAVGGVSLNQSNMGELDNRRTRQTLVRGNFALLQSQALIIACLAGALSFLIGHDWNTTEKAVESFVSSTNASTGTGTAFPSDVISSLVPRGIHLPNRPNVDRALRLRNGYLEFFMIVAVSMMSASLSSAIQGTCLCALVVWSRRYKVDPDQCVVPFAGSLGDLTTLTILGLLAAGMFPTEGSLLSLALFLVLIGFCCIMVFLTLRNVYVYELFSYGWTPLFVAALISSLAGLLLDRNAAKFDGFALLAPVQSGLPGVAAAILTSTLSSNLHTGKILAPTRSSLGNYAPLNEADHRDDSHPTTNQNNQSLKGMVSKNFSPLCGWRLPLALLGCTTLVQVGFLLLLWLTKSLAFGWQFALCFTALSILLVCIALSLGYIICLMLWYFDYDPDTSCMPYVTSLVDVLSQILLLGTFAAARALGDKVHV